MLVLTVLLHGGFVWLLWYSMRSPLKLLDSSAPHDEAIELSLIRPPRAAPAPPPVAAPPPVLRLDHRTREISRNTMQVQLGHAPSAPPPPASAPPPAAPPKLFDATGNIVLNPQTAPAPAAAGSDYVQRAPQGDTQVMQHNAGQQYKSAPNQFNQYFPPPKETLMHGVMRRLNGSDSNTKDVELGHGLRVKCTKVFGIPTPDCHMPPPPPPSNDGDERLNMAPAALLPHAPQAPAPSVQQCIAWYKAGKPLPHGCPVDTPARAAVSGP